MYRSTLFVMLLSFPLITGCGEKSSNVAKTKSPVLPDFLKPFTGAAKVTLYSIDGTKSPNKPKPKTSEYFHDYPVLGKIEITSSESRMEIAQALNLSSSNPELVSAKCFWPRHAIQVEKEGKTTDYVICFECTSLLVLSVSEAKEIATGREPQQLLNKLLTDAGILIAP